MVGTTKTSSGRTAKHTAAAASKRCKEGYQRHNGRWEARYRPQSRHELKQDNVTIAAFKGFKKGLYKYEFLEYVCYSNKPILTNNTRLTTDVLLIYLHFL